MITAKLNRGTYDLYTDDGGFIKSIPVNQLDPHVRLALALGMEIQVDGDE